MLTKEQIKILEEALELLEEYPTYLDERSAFERYRCTICDGLMGGGNHFENCRLISTKTKLDDLIEELKKNA